MKIHPMHSFKDVSRGHEYTTTLLRSLLLSTFFAGTITVNAATEMDEMVIVASKIERPMWRVAGLVSSLHASEIRRLQITDLGEIARYEPAIEADYSGERFGATGLSIRGIGGNRVKIEMDGVPMPQNFAIGEFANNTRTTVDPALIDGIEILRGPASSLYGSDAIGGVVAIRSASPRSLIRTGSSQYVGGGGGYRSVDNSQMAYGTYAVGDRSRGLLASFSHVTSHDRDNQAENAITDFVARTQEHALIRLEPHDTLTLMVDRYQTRADSDIRSVLGFGRQYRNTVALFGHDHQTRTRYSFRFMPLETTSLVAYHQDNRTSQETSDLRADSASDTPDRRINRLFSYDEQLTGIEIKGNWTFSTGGYNQLLVAGIEWERKQLSEFRDGFDTDLLTGITDKVLPPGETLPLRDLPKTTNHSLGIYLQDELQFGDLTLIPALRWDHFELNAVNDDLTQDRPSIDMSNSDLSFRFGATQRVRPDLSLFAQYAEGFRAPPPEDVNLLLDYRGFITVRSLPNPDLVAEESKSIEAGIRFKHRAVQATVAVYQNRYDNFIESRFRLGVDPDDGALLFQSINRQRASIHGIEASVRVTLGTGMELEGGVHRARGTDKTTGAPLNSVSPLAGTIGINWQHRDLALGIRATHRGSPSHVDRSNVDLFLPPASTVLDLTAQWQPTSRIEAIVGINNLSNTKYWRYNDVRHFEGSDPRIETASMAGRNVSVTLHLRQ